jgi:hypothetical protein
LYIINSHRVKVIVVYPPVGIVIEVAVPYLGFDISVAGTTVATPPTPPGKVIPKMLAAAPVV